MVITNFRDFRYLNYMVKWSPYSLDSIVSYDHFIGYSEMMISIQTIRFSQ